ncbi:hypothetical protein FACS189431_1610 [Alphaproteobacteria bacterium]|nr:hypothetical protein FACS189431_1610 [Alphaproteobacteria bacterium]
MKIIAAAKRVKRGLASLVGKAKQAGRISDAEKMLANLTPGDYFVMPSPSANITQWASPNLVSKILNHEIEAGDDPRWREFGFKTKADYAFWSWRIYGLMCFKSVLDSYGVAKGETVASLTKKGEDLGGYKAKADEGWFYAPLIKLARGYAVDGGIYGALDIREIAAAVLKNRFVVASVHPDVIRGDIDKKPQDDKGHLVLVWGFRWDGGKITGFFINNPSGREKSTQVKAFIPITQFDEAFAGRGFWLKHKKLETM